MKKLILYAVILIFIAVVVDSLFTNSVADTTGYNSYQAIGKVRIYPWTNRVKLGGGDTLLVELNGSSDALNLSGQVTTRTYKNGTTDTWRGGSFVGFRNFVGGAPVSDVVLLMLSGIIENTNISNLYAGGATMNIRTGKNFPASNGRVPTYFDFVTTYPTNTYLNAFKIGQYGNVYAAQGVYAGYEGNLISGYWSNPTDTTYITYLFNGKGNFPSYFGGVVNAEYGYNYFSDAQVNDTYVLTISGITAYAVGQEITFKANTANTDGATVNVNAMGAKALTKVAGGSVATALATGDIIAGQMVKAIYDGTRFQIISRLAQ